MIYGDSSSFIEDASEYISKNNKPVNLILRSNRGSNSVSQIIGFVPTFDKFTGNEFWRFKNKGGNDSFYSFSSNVQPKTINSLNLRMITDKAKNQELFKSDKTKNVDRFEPFAAKVYPSHYSAFFFDSYQRDGYILEVDEDKEYRLNENTGDLEVYMKEMLRSPDFYYYFYPDSKFSIFSTGYKGIATKVMKKTDLPSDAIIVL